MVGNSWIYKSKYTEEPSSSSKPKERGRGRDGDKPGFGRSQTGNSIKSDSGVQEVLREEKLVEKKKRDKSRTRTMFGLRKVKD